jgi:DNA end-binding protein Ku
MAQAVWTGSLSFGLVNIGVRLFPATAPKDVRFHLVDDRGRRVHYRRFVDEEPDVVTEPAAGDVEAAFEVRPEDQEAEPPPDAVSSDPQPEREVDYSELMRGYETDQGVVVLSSDEIESARPQRSRAIDIEDFVDLSDIDPVYFEKSYLLVPTSDAEKAYALLLRAMEQEGLVGIGRFVLRTKPHLVAIRPTDGALGLETLFFNDEVRDRRALVPDSRDAKISKRELELAKTLIQMLKADWDPSRYSDAYREELLRRIAEKTPEAPAAPPRIDMKGSGIAELMEALRGSVEEAKKAKKRQKKRSA